MTNRAFGHSLQRGAETRLAQKLAPIFSEMTQSVVMWADIKIFPARGYWRQKRADVQQFTGYFLKGNLKISFGCWESMTDCLRFGFEVRDSRHDSRAYADFEINAKPETRR